jgi:molybdopterin-guanine dinucleotide biosynthesis protein B
MTAKRFGIAGWSGSGKTTLVRRLVPELIGRGLTVSTVKHAHHDFDIDRPGKDSYEHREAGAKEVMVASSVRWALIHEGRGETEPSLDELVQRMAPVDLILIEGFKSESYQKLEVHRPSLGKKLLCLDDTEVVALASDASVEGTKLPVLDLDDVAAIADFIIAHCGLAAARGAA